jgi:1-deoxy-D-xylulose-5-phosphate synthase
MLQKLIGSVQTIFTVEENTCHGGLSSTVHQYCGAQNSCVKVHCIGLPDGFVEHGARSILLKVTNLDAEGIASRITSVL